ncbi:lysophospholipid acyltransferase family protein [Streptomyces sp. TRM 70361]|uniref:lysophospholipid acyltransferase family protein n=1 Tax=Streptomyces sp. TRM 70361 TaxID=3116553 RepID=UPI002E7B7CA8|nr:lysophospholipid acyltransferase family protein [Streptomyces sp. TRM 70361]MEE1943411.1 lysophospholipid acyltransferase family protein [Streptomyces sp. TRM 70361]MEE1943412.1 lysophospholipid acyltransferase family protein [Streptomyces sp. TRM 70361]
MADAKVIPFDDDRSRGGTGRAARGRPAGGGARRRTGAGDGDHGGRDVPGTGRGAGRSPQGGVQPPLAAVPAGPGPVAEDVRGTDEPGGAGEIGEAGGAGETGEAGERAARETSGPAADASRATGREAEDWDRRIARGLAFLRRRITGDYEVDEFGYDAELTDQVLLSGLRPLYEKYFRVEVLGIENIPAEGGALVVANHSGTLPLDALMLQVAVHDHHPARRALRLLAADLVFVLPVVSELARKAGHTLACAEDAQRLLERGEIVGVMPEGFKGLGKPFSERYKLQRFGRGGFVSTALRAGVPIVPCSIVGAEEIYPMIGSSRTLARLLGFPYFPVTPTFPWLGPLGMVPLPTKWTIQFGEPVPTGDYPPEADEDPMLMFNLTDQVRETIQHTLYRLLVRRRSVFF